PAGKVRNPSLTLAYEKRRYPIGTAFPAGQELRRAGLLAEDGCGGCGVDLARRVAEVAAGRDVVPLEHRPRLVAGQLLRHALRNTRAHEVAHGASSHVVRDATGTTCCDARHTPRLLKHLHRFRLSHPHSPNNPPHDVPGLR